MFTVSTMPMIVASTGSFSVSGVKRALEPCTIKTISSCPAPTVSTHTNVRPVPTRRSRPAGSTRSGSTVSSLRPVIDATLCVAITLPVTLARNMNASLRRFEQLFRLSSDDQLLVGRHDPDVRATSVRVDARLATCGLVLLQVQLDAEPIQVRANRLAHVRRVLADAAGEDDGIGPIHEQQVRAEVVADRGDEDVAGQLGLRITPGCSVFDVAQVVEAAEAQQPGPVRQVVEELLQRLARSAHERGQGERIEVADAVVVRQAGLGAHAQAVTPRLAILDGAQRTAPTQVARDDA